MLNTARDLGRVHDIASVLIRYGFGSLVRGLGIGSVLERTGKVLLVCSETYRRRFDGLEERGKGLGANFEGYLILQELLDSGMRHRKIHPDFAARIDA
jgi:hypothetical protein